MTNKSKFNISNFAQFLKTDIWRIRASTLSNRKSFWIRQLRIILLAVRGFGEDSSGLKEISSGQYSELVEVFVKTKPPKVR